MPFQRESVDSLETIFWPESHNLYSLPPIFCYLTCSQPLAHPALLLFTCPVVSNSFETPWTVAYQAPLRFLGWVAISSRGSSWPRDWTRVSHVSCTGKWILSHWATREASDPRTPWQNSSFSQDTEGEAVYAQSSLQRRLLRVVRRPPESLSPSSPLMGTQCSSHRGAPPSFSQLPGETTAQGLSHCQRATSWLSVDKPESHKHRRRKLSSFGGRSKPFSPCKDHHFPPPSPCNFPDTCGFRAPGKC